MDRRVDFHNKLLEITSHVYFTEPRSNVTMQYPCIVYARDASNARHADNQLYRYSQRYQVTIIANDPDTDIFGKVAEFPQSAFQRNFAANNLNHDVFVIYF